MGPYVGPKVGSNKGSKRVKVGSAADPKIGLKYLKYIKNRWKVRIWKIEQKTPLLDLISIFGTQQEKSSGFWGETLTIWKQSLSLKWISTEPIESWKDLVITWIYRDISFCVEVFALSNYVVFFAPFYYHFRRNVSNIKSASDWL